MNFYLKSIILLAAVLFSFVSLDLDIGQAQSASNAPSNRLIVIISDLHWGLGKDASGHWDPQEDFRWGIALDSFLDKVSNRGGGAVDLIILGDLLELWQHPETINCLGKNPDLGCTTDEIKAVAEAVCKAHQNDFDLLRRFAMKEENRLYVVPGNHDAALLLPEVWDLVYQLLGGDQSRVTLARLGIWSSADGLIVAEHGHQIGRDVNRYENWPMITQESEGSKYLVRPWGEFFVQSIFNDEESRYPIIDNLSPESAGVRYRAAERGLMGSAADIARFVAFNIFQTSLAQKAAFLGRSDSESNVVDPEDRAQRRKERAQALGHQLFLKTLLPTDPLYKLILDESTSGQALRQELDAIVSTMTIPEIEALCLMAAQNHGSDPCTDQASLGMIVQRLLLAKKTVMKQHLEKLLVHHQDMTVFIYGHTHAAEKAWEVGLKDGRKVTVLNSGAFQRLVDEEGYVSRSTDWDHLSQGLSELDLEDLSPCYSAVVIDRKGGRPHPRLEFWNCPETGNGRRVAPGDPSCR